MAVRERESEYRRDGETISAVTHSTVVGEKQTKPEAVGGTVTGGAKGLFSRRPSHRIAAGGRRFLLPGNGGFGSSREPVEFFSATTFRYIFSTLADRF